MEDKSILEVLTQLESDLKDIKAAKEQIDDVLEADSEINKNLADYSQQLASIATQLGSLKELIKSEVKGFVSDVNSDVAERLASVSQLVSNIGILSSEIEGNAKKVVSNITEAFNDSCSNVIKSFEYSTKNTSEQFSKQTLTGVEKLVQATMDFKESATDFSGSKKEIFQKIDALAGDLSCLVTKNTQQIKELKTANENINQILINLKNHETSLQNVTKTIEEKNDKLKDELKGAIDTNKKFLFGVIFLVVVDIILRFVV